MRTQGSSNLTVLMASAQYARVNSMKKNLKSFIVTVLAVTLAFAYVPGAHANSNHSSMTIEIEAIAGDHTAGAAHHAHTAIAAPQSADEPHQTPCCDEAGLCSAGIALSMVGPSPEHLPIQEGETWSAIAVSLSTYNPALDLPPPKNS